MLAAGYLSLADLKARIMPDPGDDETQWDDKLTALALGVVARFDTYTARTLERGEAVEDDLSARASSWTLLRYPVESLTGVELVDRDGTTSSQSTADVMLQFKSGVVEIPETIGSADQRIRFTYTGGFWLDDGNTQPSGSTAMPADLLDAFAKQVQHEAEAAGIFGDQAMRVPTDALASLGMIPMVAETLDRYRRFGGE